MGEAKTKGLMDLLSDIKFKTSERRKVAEPELGIQAGENPDVCLFPSSSQRI